MQLRMFALETEWVCPDSFPDLKGYKEICIDLETKDPGLMQKGSGWATKHGHIIGIAVAVEGDQWYFPIRHENGGNLDSKRALGWLKDVVSIDRDYVFHNASYDVGWLLTENIEVKGRIVDTMVVGALLNENRFSYSLNALAKDYLGERKQENDLREAAAEFGVNPKSEMYKLPAQYVGLYAEQDAAITLRLWQRFKTLVVEENIQDIFELELNVLRATIPMRQKGVRVDLEKAEKLKLKLQKQENDIIQSIKKQYSVNVDLWAAMSIAKAFDSAGLKYNYTEKTEAPSFTKHFLSNHNHELPRMIVKAREYNKARTTFIDTILRHQHEGRVHAEAHSLRCESFCGAICKRCSYRFPPNGCGYCGCSS